MPNIYTIYNQTEAEKKKTQKNYSKCYWIQFQIYFEKRKSRGSTMPRTNNNNNV